MKPKIFGSPVVQVAGKADREWITVGWREMLEGEDQAAPLVPSKRPKCTRCQEHQADKVGNRVPKIPWSFEEHDPAIQERILTQGHQPLQDRPAFAYGIVAQEVFAGTGWTKAMKEAGHRVLEPIEIYEDPLRQKGYRAEHDLKDPKVRKRLTDQAKELPGPDAPNLYHLGTPCTSYCDFNLLNGGTRTYERPQGDPDQLTESESDGNLFCDFTCELCLEAYNHDKEFVVENTMPTGRYPKLWDQPAMQRLQRATGALFIPAHLCEWGLSPLDQPTKRYRKGQWNLVSPGIYAYALLLARPCQRNHDHEPLKGSATSGTRGPSLLGSPSSWNNSNNRGGKEGKTLAIGCIHKRSRPLPKEGSSQKTNRAPPHQPEDNLRKSVRRKWSEPKRARNRQGSGLALKKEKGAQRPGGNC